MDKILKFSCFSALSNSKTMWLCLKQPGVIACQAALACQLTPLVRFHNRQLETQLYAHDLKAANCQLFYNLKYGIFQRDLAPMCQSSDWKPSHELPYHMRSQRDSRPLSINYSGGVPRDFGVPMVFCENLGRQVYGAFLMQNSQPGGPKNDKVLSWTPTIAT